MRQRSARERWKILINALSAAVVVLLALASSALGQTAPLAPDATQAQLQSTARPARKPFRAARLTLLTGDVLVEQAGNTNRESAVLNMPLVEGSVISTGEDGQAEIEFEDGSIVRLTPNSGLSLIKLAVDGNGNFQTRASVIGGLAYLELRAGTKYQYRIDAAGDSITPIENSTIRVDLDEPPAAIAILDGLAHIAAVAGSSDIDAAAGQTIRMDATEGPIYLVRQEITPESWDQWNEDRDRIASNEASSQTAARDQYAGDQGYGWSDLDANGNWYDVPGQGEVWQPTLASDSGDTTDDSFDPYGYGNWVWTPVGYSWASGYGWGWLPYRCGQWGYWDGFGWGWQPGFTCGAFGFGGYGYGFGGINIYHPPSFWHRPRRPIPGPGPFHPIVKGPTGSPRIASGQSFTGGHVLNVKTIAGKTVQPLAPIDADTQHGSYAIGSSLQRDYPVNTSTREPSLGIVSTHPAPFGPATGPMPWEPGRPSSGATSPRSHMMPAQPRSGYSPGRPTQPGNPGYNRTAPVNRPAPAPHNSPPASAPSHPASSSSPHK